MIRSFSFAVAALAVTSQLFAAPKVDVSRAGAARIVVSVETPDNSPAAKAFNTSLKRNLGISGYFQLGPNGQIKITGTPGAGVVATGGGKQVKSSAVFSDAASARMAAREFSDTLVAAYNNGKKGFARERIAFVNRKGKDNGELFMCYPDGYDIVQLTSDHRAVVGPRWAPNKSEIFYTGFLQGKPLVYRIDTKGRRSLLAQFKGLATGAAVTADGRRCAIILSHQGNPELYVIDLASKMVNRMTRTPSASEASPCWSPNASKIVYVTDLARQPQLYLLDVASKKSTRLTSQGSQNTNPDWGPDGRIVYASKRAGQNVLVVMDPMKGEASAKVVTKPGNWEHPSWASDGRHVIAERDGALFIVDTDPNGDPPVQLFRNPGFWMNPAWCR